MQNALSILIAILMFGVLIAVHEFGHFFTAKLLGVKVNEFAIGMGPQLFHKTKGETEYSLRAFPVGGFCAMEGEDEATGDPRSFVVQAGWKKFIILAAGSVMNFLTGLVLLVILMGQNDYFTLPVVASLEPEFPAQGEDGLMPGDRIVRIDGHMVLLGSDVQMLLNRASDPVDLVIERDGERIVLNDFLSRQAYSDPDGGTSLRYGFSIQTVEATPLLCLQQAMLNSVDFVRLVWMGLVDLVTGAVGLRDLSGPIGIVDAVGDAGAQAGNVGDALYNVFIFMALIAINLAVMNLLPIPALDGGRIFFLIVGGLFHLLTRKRLNPKYENWVNAAGFVFLMGLMVVVAASDILKLLGV